MIRCHKFVPKVFCAFASELFDIYPIYITTGLGLHSKMEEYLTALFNCLDENNDGSLSDEAKHDKLMRRVSLKLFEMSLDNAFDFFDSNQDSSVALDDAWVLGPGTETEMEK